tara:strand:- start:8 stop:385 length:378 start_codon:yes stop_codon:yes gene_type:complete
MGSFALIEDANEAWGLVNGTSLKSHIAVKPIDLIFAFGQPLQSDGYKVSGEYVFKHRSGEVITMYDWKWTTLYDPEAKYKPSELWALNKNIEFNLGAKDHSYIDDFQDWLPREINKRKQQFDDKR